MALFEIDGRWWREFNRQLKAAGDDAPNAVKDLWARILEPMRADWEKRIPSSRLKRTVKVRRKAQGEIWAGHARKGADRPFLPWLEFGGTIRFQPGPRKFVEVVKLPGGFITVPTKGGVHRDRVKEGRYMGPAVEGKADEIADQFAEAVVDIFNKHFR